jgi:DNA polymerase III psi subunit
MWHTRESLRREIAALAAMLIADRVEHSMSYSDMEAAHELKEELEEQMCQVEAQEFVEAEYKRVFGKSLEEAFGR